MLFKDQTLNGELQKNGYVKIPFFEEEQLQAIKRFHKSVSDEDWGSGIFMSSFSSNMSHKTKVGSFLKELFEKRLQEYFNSHRILNPIFIVKHPGKETKMDIHQDWSIVDESKFWSANIWVPLDDVEKKNGALWLLNGSHKVNQPVRGGGVLTPIYPDWFDKFGDRVQPLSVKAGEAVVFFHSLLHGSFSNISDRPRIIATTSIVPEEAPLKIYFQRTGDSKLELYEAVDNFMFAYNNIRDESGKIPPKGKLLETFPPQKLNEISIAELTECLNSAQD